MSVRVRLGPPRLLPESWDDSVAPESTRNWFVLTGASAALVKCTTAERLGSAAGFLPGHFMHEHPDREWRYFCTPIVEVSRDERRDPRLYPSFYERVCENAVREINLPREQP